MLATDAADIFEAHRPMMTGIAYRMLGSITDAEDVVQSAYVRWHETDRGVVKNAPAFLRTIVTRLCLDQIESGRTRREEYIGPWLPEPLVDRNFPAASEEAIASDVSTALMLTLERLSPLERAAFLLHDVFGVDFDEIAAVLDRSEAACRQLASRARDHVRANRPRFLPAKEDQSSLADAFMQAARSGDVAALTRLLADQAQMHTDGGGKAKAALNIIFGRDKIIRFLVAKAGVFAPTHARAADINGVPGFVAIFPDGHPRTLAFDFDESGKITALYAVANPDKLRGIA